MPGSCFCEVIGPRMAINAVIHRVTFCETVLIGSLCIALSVISFICFSLLAILHKLTLLPIAHAHPIWKHHFLSKFLQWGLGIQGELWGGRKIAAERNKGWKVRKRGVAVCVATEFKLPGETGNVGERGWVSKGERERMGLRRIMHLQQRKWRLGDKAGDGDEECMQRGRMILMICALCWWIVRGSAVCWPCVGVRTLCEDTLGEGAELTGWNQPAGIIMHESGVIMLDIIWCSRQHPALTYAPDLAFPNVNF